MTLPPWDKTPEKPQWTLHNRFDVYENPWLKLEVSDVTAPTGHECIYGVVRFQNRAVGVLPIFDDGTVMLVGQMRYATDHFSWEMPEGGVPFSEDILDGAKRELAEEAGLLAQNWTKVLEMDLSNSITDEVATCYIATDLSVTETAPDATEALQLARVPFYSALNSAIKGEIRDALTVATLLRAYHMVKSGEANLPLGQDEYYGKDF